jgi:hypothetical protein
MDLVSFTLLKIWVVSVFEIIRVVLDAFRDGSGSGSGRIPAGFGFCGFGFGDGFSPTVFGFGFGFGIGFGFGFGFSPVDIQWISEKKLFRIKTHVL